jgi:hypothetical protein
VGGHAQDAPAQFLLKPFMTESTTISAMTPRAMPAMEITEMKEMKWLRRLARV